MSTEVSAVRTVNRIADILNSFSRENPVNSLTAISVHLGLPRSTVHRLLRAMEDQGLLMREAGGRGYRLGYQLLYWGMVAQASLDLRHEAQPVLQALTQATGETAILSVRDGQRGICLAMVESSHPVRLAMQVGERLRLHAGASAKVLWAFLPDAEVESILGSIELAPLKPRTITDPELLREELRAIYNRGYATSFEETDCGAMGIAAPVYDYTGRVVAGIGIAAPLARIPPAEVLSFAPAVLGAGQQLSARLGART